MTKLSDLLSELGISKVKLARYLGVSRQMVYNYLELDDLNKWPKEKKMLLLKLLDIDNCDEDTLENIKFNTDYIMTIDTKLNKSIKVNNDCDNYFDLKGLNKEEQTLIGDITYLIKEKILDDDKKKENLTTIHYLQHMLQSLDNVPEIKYILGYISKTTGFTDPNEFKYDEEKQFIFEGILFTALTLYTTGGASKSKLLDSHRRFVQEIEERNEEKLTRTQQLNTVRVQALKELGYSEINTSNATEVFEKIAEIQSRKV